MRIKEIKVEKLFGLYDYTIPLNMDERVTIIIGPNGYGKTTILKMVNALFNLKFSVFFKIPFKEFMVKLDNDAYIIIAKETTDDSKGNLTFVYKEKGSKEYKYDLSDLMKIARFDLRRRPFSEISLHEIRHIEFIERRRFNRKIDLDNTLEDLEELFDNKELKPDIWGISSRELKKAFALIEKVKSTNGLDVCFIETQRLLRDPRTTSDREEVIDVQVVNKFSKDLALKIGSRLEKSTQVSQKLDSSFPKRVINKTVSLTSSDKSFEELLIQLNDLREQRESLKENGFPFELDTDIEIESEIINDKFKEEFLSEVLSIYINDTNDKLAVFEDLSNRIEKLKDIINHRFNHKSLSVDREKGFMFTTDTDEIIFADSLSSGEQHQLVIFYQFLFEINEGSFVLIDEPELSFHMEWKQKFLEDIIEIAKIARYDVLIATHSMDIVNHHWELTYDLGGDYAPK